MPKVKFTSNLGSRDAHALGLDHTKCAKGMYVDISSSQMETIGKMFSGLVMDETAGKAEDRADAKAEADMKTAELEKLTAPEPAKK